MKTTGVTAIATGESEESTRRRVAATILQLGAATAQQLADALDLTPAAVRRHLSALVERGHLTTRDARPGVRGRGRPAKEFVLTDLGRAAFHQGYDDLAIEVLDFLSASGGDDAVAAFAEARARRVEERYRGLLDADPGLTPTQALTQALDDSGYVAQQLPSRAGEQVCQHHCPVAHVAARYPQLCEAETRVFSRLLGSHVQRIATIAHGDAVCTTHVPQPRTTRGDA